MTQDGFWDWPPTGGQAGFDAWIVTDTGVWVAERALMLCRRRIAEGMRRAGIKALIEDIRWGDDYDRRTRLKNDLAPYLARWLMAEYPELDGWFELRPLRRK